MIGRNLVAITERLEAMGMRGILNMELGWDKSGKCVYGPSTRPQPEWIQLPYTIKQEPAGYQYSSTVPSP